jgi:hypothetical protein
MKKMTQEIKRMLESLALANAGENLTRRQKSHLIAGKPVPVAQNPKHRWPSPAAAGGPVSG